MTTLCPKPLWHMACILGIVLILAFGLIKPIQAQENPTHNALENTPGPLYPLVIQTAQGPVKLQVEIARTLQQQRIGLMYRRSMPDDQGMIFLYNQPRILSMWMKNTFIALDMLFVDQFSTIHYIHSPAIPHDETIIAAPQPSVAVLELNAGTAARLGIRVGDKLQLSAP